MALTMLPSQNWDHMIECVSGGNTMHDLQFAASPASGETIYRGSLVSLDSDGEFQAGLSAQTAMPMWAINGSGDYDTGGGSSFEIGNTTTFGGKVGAWVATGGYELFTSEYVSGTYNVNAQLAAATGGNAGKVTTASSPANDNAVVGVVSRGVSTFDEYQKATTATTGSTTTKPSAGGKQVLYFWPVYLPAISTTDYISDSSAYGV